MNIRSLSTGGLPAGDLMAVRMEAISAHASSVSNKRTDIRFPLAGIVMNGREKTYPGIMNSSTRPSTTVVDRVLSWFPTHAGGGHHGSVAVAGFLSRQCDPGDGTYVGAVADGGGATAWAPIRPTRGSVACLGVYAWLAEPDRAQTRLATRRSPWRSDPIRRPAFVGTGDLGRRCPP